MDETAIAPFQFGTWLLSHNGIVDRALLPPQSAAESVCDSAQLAAFIFASGPESVGKVVADLGGRSPTARLNVLLTNGERVLATRWNDTLSVLAGREGVLIASEPVDDDPGWVDVPDRHLVEATPTSLTITSLEN
jgi:glutamine amidotransferase